MKDRKIGSPIPMKEDRKDDWINIPDEGCRSSEFTEGCYTGEWSLFKQYG